MLWDAMGCYCDPTPHLSGWRRATVLILDAFFVLLEMCIVGTYNTHHPFWHGAIIPPGKRAIPSALAS
jgi:hypothetical protein